jgi:Trk K+ transport system NAD-binding subunit
MGNVGWRIVQLLRRLGEDVVVVTRETRAEWLHAAQADGISVVQGDARDEALLEQAGIGLAQALIAATDHDPTNIEIALDAKRARPGLPVVVRLFDQHLARQMESGFDLRRALAVSGLAAPSFAAAALGERWIGAFALDGAEFVVGKVAFEGALGPGELTANHGLLAVATEEREEGARATVVGRRSDWERWVWGQEGRPDAPARSRGRLRAVLDALRPSLWLGYARRIWRDTPLPLRSAFVVLNVIIALSVLVFRSLLGLTLVDALYYSVTTVATGAPSDIAPRGAGIAIKLYACFVMLLGSAVIAILYSIITDFLVTARFRQLLGRERIPEKGHVVVAGLGNVGYRVVQELKRAGAPVVAIERDAAGEFVDAVRSMAPVVIGDARIADTLSKAGAAKADAIVAAIDDDAFDLGIALAARALNPRARIVTRVFDADFARKIQAAFQVEAALSPGLMAAPTFVAAALYPGVLAAFVQGRRLFVVLRRARPDDWQGLTPSQLATGAGVQVLLRRPGGVGEPSLGGGEQPIAADEEIVAVVSRELN